MNYVNEDQALLKTIVIPKNLIFLGNNLPEPNYIKKKFNSYTNLKNANNEEFNEKEKEKNNTNNKINIGLIKDEIPDNISNRENNKNEDEKKVNENKKDEENKINEEEEKIKEEKEKKVKEEREKKRREEKQKKEHDMKIRENELQLKKQLEDKEKEALKYNQAIKNIQEDSKNTSKEVTQRSHKNILNNKQSHKKIILPEIRNSYDITPINLNYNNNIRPIYDGYNRSKKYRILLSSEEEEINKLYKIYAPVLKPQNKIPRYIYNNNLQIKHVPKPYNYYNNIKKNNERYNDGRRLNPIARKYFNNLY